jgi:hypothetical protein
MILSSGTAVFPEFCRPGRQANFPNDFAVHDSFDFGYFPGHLAAPKKPSNKQKGVSGQLIKADPLCDIL